MAATESSSLVRLARQVGAATGRQGVHYCTGVRKQWCGEGGARKMACWGVALYEGDQVGSNGVMPDG